MYMSRHYPHPPIIEAIIDLRVALPEGFSIDRLASIHTRVSKRFPQQDPIIAGSLVFQATPDISLNASSQQNGYLFRSEDNLNIFQATLNGFTFNRLAPYTSWEDFSGEAKLMWEIYREVCQPLHVTRAAVRFVNRLDLPAKDLELKDYLSTLPSVAPDLPQALSNFFMQLQIPQRDLDCMMIINQALVPQTSSDFVNVILDFDLFREHIWQNDDEEMWKFMEQLRHRKNEAFEASITDNTRRLFD